MRLAAGLVCGLAVGLELLGAGCGGGPAATNDGGVASCTLVEFFTGGETATLCFETSTNAGPGFPQSCAQNTPPADAGTVTFTDGPCSRTDALGACRTSVYGLVEDQWYYGSGGDSGTSVFGQTASDIKTLCAQMGSTYLPP